MNGSWGKVMVESLRIICLTSTELSLNKYIVFQLTRQVKNQVIFKSGANRASEVCGHGDYNPRAFIPHHDTLPLQADWKIQLQFSITAQDVVVTVTRILFPLLIYVDAFQVAQCCGISKQKSVLGIGNTGRRQTWDLGTLPGLYLQKYYPDKTFEISAWIY